MAMAEYFYPQHDLCELVEDKANLLKICKNPSFNVVVIAFALGRVIGQKW